jgi:hypothetical protein
MPMPDPRQDTVIRIGGASGFWGESPMATAQLLADGALDYLVYDYLAEITMSIMARARAADPTLGYAVDFVTAALRPNLDEIARQGVKVISNAGGVNPRACAAAVRQLIEAAGLNLRVAVVSGDDLLPRAAQLASCAPSEMFSGASFPPVEKLASINAYLGAFPIAEALDAGADIVITGRVVDSAVTLGACIHAFGWGRGDLDRLAGGSLAGHILECGPQATGGNFTDWELAAAGYADIGYPIAEVAEDGTFVCTKPAGSGGLVTPHTVGEQMLYEIGDPQAYLLPDVVCDFSAVMLEQQASDRVDVRGARGYPPPAEYKVSATWADGFRGGLVWFFCGFEADRKARVFADAALQRARRRLAAAGLADFTETCVELIGDESHYGARRAVRGSREVAVKIAARHPESKALVLLLQEITGLALGGPPGLTGFAGGRPKPSPVIRLFSFRRPKQELEILIELDDRQWAHRVPRPAAVFDPDRIVRPAAPAPVQGMTDLVEVPLIQLAVARSGDKGDKANIGVMARRPEFLPWIWAALTEHVVAGAFAHFLDGRAAPSVERFHLPGSQAVNFLLHGVLGGGGIASLRNDPQGKTFAQLLLDYPIPVARTLMETR